LREGERSFFVEGQRHKIFSREGERERESVCVCVCVGKRVEERGRETL